LFAQQSLEIQCKNAYFFTGELYKALKYSVKVHEFCKAAQSNPEQPKAAQTGQPKQPKAARSNPKLPQAASKKELAQAPIVTAFVHAFLKVPKRIYRKLLVFLEVPKQPLK